MTTVAEPTDRLPDEIIRTLRQFGLPFEGLIRHRDLVKARIFRARDYHGLERLKALGFPSGKWLGSNTKIYTPLAVGTFLLNLPTERPVQPPKAERRAAAKSAKAPSQAHDTEAEVTPMTRRKTNRLPRTLEQVGLDLSYAIQNRTTGMLRIGSFSTRPRNWPSTATGCRF